MALPRIYINNQRQGFTLIEVLMVLAMLSFIASATVLFSLSFFQGELVRNEENTLVNLLHTARAKAMQNQDGVAHGVAIDPIGVNEYVLFSGNSFVNADPSTVQSIPRANSFAFATNSLKEIVFFQLSGEVKTGGEIIVINTNKNNSSSTITINYEGAIY